MDIEAYVINHTIVKVGNTLPKYLFNEVIVDNPIELISLVNENKSCYISYILWWVRAKISEGSAIGYGGPRDPRNPDESFFSETIMCRNFSENTDIKEYLAYIEETLKSHPNYDLYPGFDIAIVD